MVLIQIFVDKMSLEELVCIKMVKISSANIGTVGSYYPRKSTNIIFLTFRFSFHSTNEGK